MKLWKQLVGLFFLLVLLDGALRKWVMPGFSRPLFILKDIVLWGGYLSYALKRDPFRLPQPLQSTWFPTLLAGYVFVVLLQAFNLRQPSLLVSALGLKAHLAFVPLAVLLPALIAQVSERQMTRFLWGYAVFLHLPILALCIYQFFQPPGAWINQYVRSSVIASVGGHPRVTGTFSYISGATTFLRFSASLSTGVLLAGIRWRRRPLTILGVILLATSVTVLPMPGSRGPVFIFAGSVAVLLLIVRLRGTHLLRLVGVLALGSVLLVLPGKSVFSEGWEVVTERTEGAGDRLEGRAEGLVFAPVEGIEGAGLFGYGVGTNHQAASNLMPQANWSGWLGVDNGVLRIVSEVGILGWLVLMALKISLLFLAYQAVRWSHTPAELVVAATTFCFMIPKLVFPVVFNAVGSAIYWGTAGAMLGIWSVQRARRRENRGVLT